MAFITAGIAPAHPASPHPLTPNALVVAGDGRLEMWESLIESETRDGFGFVLKFYFPQG